MKKFSLLFVSLSLFVSMAGATTVFQQCTSPSTEANPPVSGALPDSVCAGYFTLVNAGAPATGPAATDIIDGIRLISRYSISLELGGAGSGTGTAEFIHNVNGIGAPFSTTFDNPLYNLVLAPQEDNVWGAGTCATLTAQNCSVITALNGGVTVSSSFRNTTDQTSGVTVDYGFEVVFHTPSTGVPEPLSMSLFGLGLVGIGLGRRFFRS